MGSADDAKNRTNAPRMRCLGPFVGEVAGWSDCQVALIEEATMNSQMVRAHRLTDLSVDATAGE
jgi:hypothetical protein